jgi:hypothetical protein
MSESPENLYPPLTTNLFLFAFALGNHSPQVPSQSSQPRPVLRQTTLVNCPYKNWHVYFPDDGMMSFYHMKNEIIQFF